MNIKNIIIIIINIINNNNITMYSLYLYFYSKHISTPFFHLVYILLLIIPNNNITITITIYYYAFPYIFIYVKQLFTIVYFCLKYYYYLY